MHNQGTVDYNVEYSHIYYSDIGNGKLKDEQIKSIEITQEILHNLRRNGLTYSLNVLVDDYSENLECDTTQVYDLLANYGMSPDHICLEACFAGELSDTLINSLSGNYIHLGKKDDLIFDVQTIDSRIWEPSPKPKSFREILFCSANSKKPSKKSFKQIFFEDEYENYSKNTCDSLEKSSLIKNSEAYIRESYQSRIEVVLKHKTDLGVTLYACPVLASCWYLFRLGVEPFKIVENDLFSFSDKPFFGKKLITILPNSYLKVEATVLEILAASRKKSFRKKRSLIGYHFF